MAIVIFDLETNIVPDKDFADLGQLAISQVVCASMLYQSDAHSPPFMVTYDGTSMDIFLNALDKLTEDDVLIGHNIIRFDIPVLERLYNYKIKAKVYDTLIASKILYPTRESHSLDGYAKLFGREKPKLSDAIADMKARCEFDVELTKKLYDTLAEQALKWKIPDDVFNLEFRVAEIIAKQHQTGVHFDTMQAVAVHKKMEQRMEEIQRIVGDQYNMVPIPKSKLRKPPKIQFLKNGEPSVNVYKYVEEHGGALKKICVGPETKWYAVYPVSWSAGGLMAEKELPLTEPLVTTQRLDLNAVDPLKEFLILQGWKPTLWNKKKTVDATTGKWVYQNTSPKLYDENKELCPSLAKLKIPHMELIAEFLTLRNRANVILSKNGTGWLNNRRIAIDCRLCADADTLGAETARFTHKIVANVPRVTSHFGKEIRSMFRATPGLLTKFVGWDASSLEARMEAHYSFKYDKGAYARELMEGDIHTMNMKMVGLKDRDTAKKFKYAITYGAGPQKLSTTFGWSYSEATLKYRSFWETNKALSDLKEELFKFAQKNGYVLGLDGRRIPCPFPHTALNRTLQSAGAIVMKYAMVLADKMISKEGLTAYGLIRYHDEEQWEANVAHAERVGLIGVKSIELAGKYLKLNVPLTGEYKVGNNWAETH